MKKLFKNKNLFYLFSLLGLLILSILLFWPALKVGFVADDIPTLRWYKSLITPVSITGFGPPSAFFFWLIRITHDNAFWPHLVLLFLHFINSFLILISIYYLTKNKLLSFLVSFAFLIFYRSPEMIYYLSQSNTISLFFYLSSFLSFIVFLNSEKRILYFSSILFFTLAILSHQVAIVLLPILFVYEWLFQKNFKLARKTISKYIPFVFISFIIYLSQYLANLMMESHTVPQMTYYPLSLGAASRNFANLFLSLWPIKFDQLFLIESPFLNTLISSLFFFGCLIALFMKRLDRLIRFFLIWMLLPILFYALLTPLGPRDRYLYPSVTGFVFIIFYLTNCYFLKKISSKKVILVSIFYVLWFSYSYILWQQKSIDWQLADFKTKAAQRGLKSLYLNLPTQDKHIYTVNFPSSIIDSRIPVFFKGPYDLLYQLYGPLSSYQDVQDSEIGTKLENTPPISQTEGVYLFYYKDDKVFDFSDRYPQIKELLREKLTPKDIQKNFQNPYFWDHRKKNQNQRLHYRISKGQLKISYQLSENGWVFLLNNNMPILPESKGFSLQIFGDGQGEILNIELWDIQANQSLRFRKKIDFSGSQEIKVLYSDTEKIGPVDIKGINRLKITIESEKAISGKLTLEDFHEY